jgi:hypothetical protein
MNNSTRILFLDDMQSRHDAFLRAAVGSGYVVDQVYTANDAAWKLKTVVPDGGYKAIFLDHDLEEAHYDGRSDDIETMDGRWVSRVMVSHPKIIELHKNTIIILHSLNPGGRAEMKAILDPHYPYVLRGVEEFRKTDIWKYDLTAVIGAAEKYLKEED